MDSVLDLSFFQVLLAYAFALMVLAIVRLRGINREKEILISSIRMSLQLVLTGFVLVYIFKRPNPWLTLGIILLMEAFAIHTVLHKYQKTISPQLKKVIIASLSIGTMSCLFYFLLVVVRIFPWYNPQYFIPIAGMLIGNSMTGISLGVKSLMDAMTIQRAMVEEALVLGANPQAATKSIINRTFDSAILPTLNSMMGMGIIFLPGMMTGQILSGVSPLTAISYQIAIMLGILGAVSLSVILLLQWGYKTFFNRDDQLNP
ncbi:MAG TPA: iron export ABC transporter permease subunit FetB [Caldisericia bacterium]|nr:iron export ABC transporter permease subunit FetB [Caldisericia bacterium]